MAIIPAEEKVFMVSNSTNTTYSGSAALKAMQQWYTMEDVTNTVRPYQVFTALLTQSGESDILTVYVGTDYGPNQLTIGITYTIAGNDTTDFTNVGAPNNEVGTSFIATGTNPNNQNANGQTYLDYNTGAPVATVLENTIGNIWFQYDGVGNYKVRSSDLFSNYKTTLSINLMGDDPESGYLCLGYIQNSEELGIVTGTESGGSQDNVLVWQTPIEIRVYN